MKNLKEYLKSKPLYYKDIDYEKMPKIFSEISSSFFLPKTVHIVGTNGKGSTGRYLTLMLEQNGFNVGHYTSPHILKFNERIYKNRENISDEELEILHIKLFKIVKKYEKNLSYFEYTTLLAFLAFQTCDFVVLEAGLGGEFDATNIVPKILSIVTPISYDHQNFLGSNIADIATTKINSIKNSAVIALQEFDEVYEVLKLYEKKIDKKFIYANENKIDENLNNYALKHSLPNFLKQNLHTAHIALKELGFSVDFTGLPKLNLNGRHQKVLPNVMVDVGHNEAAARANLDEFKGKKIILIYNAYKDKDYRKILDILSPIILHVELIDMNDSERENAKEEIKNYLDFLQIKHKEFKNIDKDRDYLVFGSFLVVEAFLKRCCGK